MNKKQFFKTNTGLSLVFILILAGLCAAHGQVPHDQLGARFTLEEMGKQADIIIEGSVIGNKGFHRPDGKIYTSVTVKASRIFKGEVSDSIIEIIYYGGDAGDVIVIVHNGLATNTDGMFFLKRNETEVTLRTDLHSYSMHWGNSSCVRYNIHPQFGSRAIIKGVDYDDFEKDLYPAIEAVTGQKRRVLGQNIFEQSAAKKQQQK